MKKTYKTFKNAVLYLGAIGASLFFLFFVITCTWIGYEVKSKCLMAQNKYGGDCVEAFIGLVDDETEDFRSRNDAIWALGQLGDSRALPVLNNYFTGIIPDREPLNSVISQYELSKAIKLAEGGTNLTAWAWRGSVTK